MVKAKTEISLKLEHTISTKLMSICSQMLEIIVPLNLQPLTEEGDEQGKADYPEEEKIGFFYWWKTTRR